MPNRSSQQPRRGGVYRTRDLASSNPSRVAKRLTARGELRQLAHGLFYRPRMTRFGEAPPDDRELMRAFLDGHDFVFTGPERWNALGLGSTAVLPLRVVYNHKRTGEFELGGQRFLLRRVAFPKLPTPEWYAVDLLENATLAGASADDLARALPAAVRARRLDAKKLREVAAQFGTHATQALVDRALDDNAGRSA